MADDPECYVGKEVQGDGCGFFNVIFHNSLGEGKNNHEI
jgi:hypothetical protein